MTTTREERSIEVNVISANGLKKVKTFGKQVSYVVAYVTGGKKQATRKDAVGGLDPTWNSKLTLQADEQLIEAGRANITMEIYSHGSFGDKIIGTVRVPLGEIVRDGKKSGSTPQYMAFEVQRPSGSAKGVLNVAITVGEKRSYEVQAPPAYRGQSSGVPMGYPSQGYGQGYGQSYGGAYGGGYPQQGYGYPQQGYGYPQQGYGYPQQQYAQRRQGGGFGNAGLGLGAGLLGGLLVGDMIGDMGDGGGFGGDGGGFGGDGGGFDGGGGF